MRILAASVSHAGKNTLLDSLLRALEGQPARLPAQVHVEGRQQAPGDASTFPVFGAPADDRSPGASAQVIWHAAMLDGQPLALADCAGGAPSTPGLVGAASQSDACILQIDASPGITAQARRTLYLASLLRVRHLFVAIGPLDADAMTPDAIATVRDAVQALLGTLPCAFESVMFAPMPDALAAREAGGALAAPWHAGPSLRNWLHLRTQAAAGLPPQDPAPTVLSELLAAHLIWFGGTPSSPAARYEFHHGAGATGATLAKVHSQVALDSLAPRESAGPVVAGTVALVDVMLEQPLALARYESDRRLGSFWLVDPATQQTVAAGLVTDPAPRQVFWQQATVGRAEREHRLGQKPLTVWFTGLSGAGKTTLANAVESALHQLGHATYLLDGDNIRHGLCRDLGFSETDRAENMRRVGEVARLMVDAGLVVLASFISPSLREREAVRARFTPGEFVEVYVSTPIEVCEQRDTKGLYKLARAGKLGQFTGISAPYDAPAAAELTLDTSVQPLEDCVRQVVGLVLARQQAGSP